MKTDVFHLFLSSLEANEQRTCKEFIALDDSKWSVQRNKLLSTLLLQKEYDQRKLIYALKSPLYVSMLAVEKHRMYRSLMRVVMDMRANMPGNDDPMETLRESRLLLDLGMYEESKDLANKGIDRAMEVEDVLAELHLREHLRLVMKSLSRKDYAEAITTNEYRLDIVGRKVTNLIHYNVICDRLHDHHIRFRVADVGQSNRAIDQLMTDPLLADLSQALSLHAQIRACNAWALYYECSNQYAKVEPYMRQALRLWETNPKRMAYVASVYINAVGNFVGTLVRIGRLDEVPALLERLEKFEVTGKRNQMALFRETEVQYQIYYMNSGQMDKLFEREERVLSGLQRFAKYIPDTTRITLNYNIGIAHLLQGNDGQALVTFTRIRDMSEMQARLDLQGLSRLFMLLLLWERDTDGRFPHFLRNSKRFLANGHPHFVLEEMVYSWLTEASRTPFGVMHADQLHQLHDSLRPLEEAHMIGAEELRLWAYSRATRTPIKEFFGIKTNDQ